MRKILASITVLFTFLTALLFTGAEANAYPAGCNSPSSFSWRYNTIFYRSSGWCLRSSQDGWYAYFQPGDGNFVLYDQNNHARWSSGTGGGIGAYIEFQGDGNAVIYDSANHARWQDHTGGNSLASGWFYEADRWLDGRDHWTTVEKRTAPDSNGNYGIVALGNLCPVILT